LWWVRNPLRQLAADRAKLRVPVFGGLGRRQVTADFMRTFAMLLRSGVSMMATLDLCKNSVSNRAYIGVVQDMRDSIEAGEGLEAPLRKAEKEGYLAGVVVDMLLTGEESGGLERVADQIASTYEEDIEIGVAGLTEAITPIFVVFMGFIVGGIVLGMFLPLISMIQTLSSGSL
jgi:type IV pilus assembly protein PilC